VPIPCRRDSTRRSNSRPIGPISIPLTAAAAHTQVTSARELDATFSSPLRPHERRWLGCDLTLEILHGLGVLGRHDTRLIQPLVANECQDHRTQLRAIGILLGELVRRTIAHPLHQHGNLRGKVRERSLVLLPRAPVGQEGRRGHHPTLLL
jgi:hypothetical protein